MERRSSTIKECKEIFGKYFFGPDEISDINEINIKIDIYDDVPFDIDFLYKYKDTHILLFGSSKDKYGIDINILNMRRTFIEPGFYNQDWYLNEDFVKKTLDNKWYLIRRDIPKETRGLLPSNVSSLPSAVLTTYAFFLNYFINDEILWENDFIWNSDVDHNGDRIYCGGYIDPDKINKNGFNIHRHLRIRECFGTIECF